MRRSRVLAAVAVALLIAGGALWWRDGGRVDATRVEAPAAHADGAQLQNADNEAQAPPERDEVKVPAPPPQLSAANATNAPVLRVRLLGLVDGAPWTALVRLDIDGNDESGEKVGHLALEQPDATGRVAFVLPAWAATRMRKGRLRAEDAAYLNLRYSWTGGQDLGEELLVRVHASATLTGRVVDEQGNPVKAQVTASVPPEFVGFDAARPSTSTRADGAWRLRGPASVPLKIFARATRGSDLARLLPAEVAVSARADGETSVPDLVLARGAFVTGSVRWTDGEPIAGALLRSDHDATAWTDQHGRFSLPAMPGADADVELCSVHALLPTGETRRTVPGRDVHFVLPRAIALRAVRGGNEVEDARIEFSDGVIGRTKYGPEATGRASVVPTRAFRTRATDGQRCSEWQACGPDDSGKTIDLELVHELAEIVFHVDADVAVPAAIARWRRADGEDGSVYLSRHVQDQPFHAFVEPGRYHMTVSATGNSDGGPSPFLLPIECDVVAGSEPAVVRLRAEFGGQLEITATDANGVPINGRCVIAGASAGTSQTAVDLDSDARGGWSGVLPAGSYELHFHATRGGTRHRTVTVEPRKLVRIAIRL